MTGRGIRMIWEDKGMKEGYKISLTRKILGNILLILFVLLIIDVVFVMTARINAVVLKKDYRRVFKYQLILCAILLLFALDVRFNVFTRWKRAILKAFGWLLRAVIVLLSVVILFFCGKVITGGMVNTPARRIIRLFRSPLRTRKPTAPGFPAKMIKPAIVSPLKRNGNWRRAICQRTLI